MTHLSFKQMGYSSTSPPRPGDVYWTRRIQFNDGINGKERPVIVTKVKGDVCEYLKCTSQTSNYRERYTIQDTLAAGLDRTTYVDMEKQTFHISRLSRHIGHLSKDDMIELGLGK